VSRRRLFRRGRGDHANRYHSSFECRASGGRKYTIAEHVSILVAGGDSRVVRKKIADLVVSRAPHARDCCAVGGRQTANVRDAKFDHSLGSMYSRGVFLLSASRASNSSRPSAALSESDVGMVEVVCWRGCDG
jgi:hypothetical protein